MLSDALTPHEGVGAIPALFALPDELRNQIYRLVLVQARSVRLKPDDNSEPGLLRTCRKTRQEATRIHREENRFRVVSMHLDSTILCRNPSHWAYDIIMIQILGGYNWPNFKTWLKEDMEGRVYTPGLKATDNTHRPGEMQPRIIRQAFQVVQMLREMDGYATFEDVLPMLETWLKAAELRDQIKFVLEPMRHRRRRG
ncbi:hypothetical protein Slin15195_G093290 [Septoria linicola]|uniref:Uncharacterized protein n=1 Tax=Septoria linicola TaxID=215465 RepID=A0A9Q9EMG2_9PEZI|nr:hypothetical protein Slin14017_G056400 [Septoria linicola]USW56010.1 hypothetical protein Slin15195_G093290 [Septoria linicola]